MFMKKLLMVLTAILISGSFLYAQDDPDESSAGGTFDPGDLLIEITGTPFSGSSLLDFGSFRARYAVTDVIVPRLGFGMTVNTTQSTPDVVTNLNEFEVRPGCEYHLRVDGSFRSYAALDVILGGRVASRESTTGSSVSGSTQIPSGTNYGFSDTYRGHFRYGVAVGAGAEYHLSSKFYIGAEIGFQFYNDKKNEVSVDGEVYQGTVINSHASVNTQNTIRIGFKLF